jgi:hypothetical protein
MHWVPLALLLLLRAPLAVPQVPLARWVAPLLVPLTRLLLLLAVLVVLLTLMVGPQAPLVVQPVAWVAPVAVVGYPAPLQDPQVVLQGALTPLVVWECLAPVVDQVLLASADLP